MAESIVIPDGYKYAALALRIDPLDLLPGIAGQPAPGLHILLEPPVDVPKHWQEWLGSIKTREVTEANLFLIMTRQSKTPEVLDHENLALTKSLERLYFALLMSVPYIGHILATHTPP